MALKPNLSPKRYTKRFGTVTATGNRVQIDGLKEVLGVLKLLPDRIQKKVLRQATTRACTPVVKATRKEAPVGEGKKPDGSERKHLNKTIDKRIKTYKNGSVVGIIGPIAKAAPHAKLVDQGTKPHEIPLDKPLKLGDVMLPKGFVIKHPGAKAAHFMGRAWAKSKGQAQDVMETTVAVGIEREAAKLAKT